MATSNLKSRLLKKKKKLLGKKKHLNSIQSLGKIAKPNQVKLKNIQNHQGKTVRADNLGWKSVEIPETLDDFSGLYGLEEIDGVGVRYVDGKVEFVVKDEEKLKTDDVEMSGIKETEDALQSSDVSESEAVQGISTWDSEDNEDNEDNEITEDSEDDENNENNNLDSTGFAALEADEPTDDSSLPEWADIGLSSYTLRGLTKLGFSKPTPIQKRCIPLALQGDDLIGKASTGSGKTLAYGLPILEKLLTAKDTKTPTGIIFTPTRELAIQVVDHLRQISKYFPFTSTTILGLTGGLSIQKQERLLKYENSGQVIVATPGRFLELIGRNEKIAIRMSNVEILVLDEADRLLQDGHFDEFEQILKIFKTHRSKKIRWQSLVFSATFARELFSKLQNTGYKPKHGKGKNDGDNEQQEIIDLLNSKLHFKQKPSFIDLNPNKLHKDIIETIIECLPAERDLYLYYFLLMYPGITLVFANAIDSVKRLVPFLNNLNIPTFAIHSSMIQKQRLKNLENFKKASELNENKSIVLIASDVAARGLDISGIQHVIHYHLPRSADVYIHRSGRTARSGKEGVSVMICSPQEASGPLRNLRKALSEDKTKYRGKSSRKWAKEVQRLPVESDIVSQLRLRSTLASQLADNEISTKTLSKEDNWMKQAAEELGADLSDMEEDEFLKKNRTKKQNKQLSKGEFEKKKYQLSQLLKQNIRKDLRKSYLTGGLQNLADSIVKGVGHGSILGHDKVDALQQLKKSTKKGSNKTTA